MPFVLPIQQDRARKSRALAVLLEYRLYLLTKMENLLLVVMEGTILIGFGILILIIGHTFHWLYVSLVGGMAVWLASTGTVWRCMGFTFD